MNSLLVICIEPSLKKDNYSHCGVLREERMAVVRSGYDATSHFNIMDTVRSQLDFAKKGLNDFGLKEEFLNLLEKGSKIKVVQETMLLNYGMKSLTDL